VKCEKCGRPRKLNSRGECSECVFKSNHDGKTRLQVYSERSRTNPLSKTKESSSDNKKRKRKPTGERELFLEIWNERPHICVRCGKYLGEEALKHYFSHIRSKGACPELRLSKDNIELVCMKCHIQYEFGDRTKKI